MTVNIYDDVNRLEATLRQTEEFKNVQVAAEALKADAEALNIFKSLLEAQMAMYEKQMRGEEISEDELQEAEKIRQLAEANEKVMNMGNAEKTLTSLMEEINAVLRKPFQELYKDF